MLRVLLPTNQTCLATNQVSAGCEKLSRKVESSSTFNMLHVLQGKLVLQQGLTFLLDLNKIAIILLHCNEVHLTI